MVMVCDTLVAWHGPLLEVDAAADAAPVRRAYFVPFVTLVSCVETPQCVV